MHWVNFPLMGIMLWSGLRIYWANDVYAFGIGSWEWFHFFPEGFYETFDLNQRLARGIAFHLAFAWLFVGNGLAYLAYLLATGRIRDLVPTGAEWRAVARTVLADVGIGTAPPAPRYNAAQKASYTLVLVMGAVLVASGFAIYKPASLAWLTALFLGYETARLVHFTVSALFVLFLAVHLIQVARAGWRPFAAMFTGYERVRRRRPAPAVMTDTPEDEPDA